MLLLLRNKVSKAGANRIELSRLSSEFLLISERKKIMEKIQHIEIIIQ